LKIIRITNAVGDIIELEWLRRAEAVHRQLRPHLPADYVARMRQVLAGGAEMSVCVKDEAVLGIAVFRVQEKTFSGREMYCDDLVTDETRRSSGVGRLLMAHMAALGDERGCDVLALDSGCQREQAHKFYFREGMTIPSFHFSKPLRKQAKQA
jgi:GNAT superfamily N-acetyltransferase